MRSRSSRRMLPTKRSAIALAVAPARRPDRADIDGGEHRVERSGELGVAVPDHEPEATAHSSRSVLQGPSGQRWIIDVGPDVTDVVGVADSTEGLASMPPELVDAAAEWLGGPPAVPTRADDRRLACVRGPGVAYRLSLIFNLAVL